MPYRIGKHPDCSKPFALVKKSDNKLMGCHDTRAEANDQMAALHANEKKEKGMTEEYVIIDQNADALDIPDVLPAERDPQKGAPYTKFMGDGMSEVAYVSPMITSYSQLDEEVKAQEAAWEVRNKANMFPALVSNIMWDDTITDKSAAVVKAASELAEIIKAAPKRKSTPSLGDTIKSIMTDILPQHYPNLDEAMIHVKSLDKAGMTIFKTKDGKLAWLARYSNNFLDNDIKPEIVTAESHRNFVKMVDKGEIPYPELWLAHIKGTRVGQASWVAYDEDNGVGFALAAGTFDPGMEGVARALAKTKNLGVSHGMDGKTIEYDSQDKRHIVRHITFEISPLPIEAAANKLTDFVVINKGENMDVNKVQALKTLFGLKSEDVEAIEENNRAVGKAAQEAGVIHKAIGEAAETPAAEETPVAEAPAEAPAEPVEAPADAPADAPEAPEAPTAEASEVFTKAQQDVLLSTLSANNELLLGEVRAIVEPLVSNLAAVTKAVGEQEANLEKSKPSLIEQLWSGRALKGLSVVESEETRVDGRSALGRSAPEENADAPAAPLMTSVLGDILGGKYN